MVGTGVVVGTPTVAVGPGGTTVGTTVGALVGAVVGAAVGDAGLSFASPGKVNARSSWMLVKPSPSESMFSIAVSADELRPLFRYACPYAFRLGIPLGT